jgi:hypothetical protein
MNSLVLSKTILWLFMTQSWHTHGHGEESHPAGLLVGDRSSPRAKNHNSDIKILSTDIRPLK